MERVETAWTAKEVAAYLGLNIQTVYEMAREGTIPSFKVGGARRFRPEEIRAMRREAS